MSNYQELLEKFKNNNITIEEKDELQQILKKSYYEGIALVDDTTYDNMFDLNNEPVGYSLTESKFNIVKHAYPMGSLHKLKTYEAGLDYITKQSSRVLIQPKLDGLSIALYYDDGILKNAVLRGAGDEGEDIIENASKFAGALQTIEDKTVKFVRGEIVISKTNFMQLPEGSYSNRRNAVSGIARRYDGEHADKLSIYSYDIGGDTAYSTETEKVIALNKLGFKVPFTIVDYSQDIYTQYANVRTTAEDYQMDGFVLKNDDLSGQIALKFPPEGEQTTVTGFEWNVGATGAVVPKFVFEKVNVQGTNITKAAAGSAQAVIEMKAGIGSKVLVRRMGDVIPKVTDVISYGDEPVIPTHCPVCGEELSMNGANLYCENAYCPQKLKSSCSSVFRALDIKGVSTGFIDELVDKKVLTDFPQVLTLKPEQISDNCKISKDRAVKIVELMHEKVKTINYETILWMLSINNISGKAIKTIVENITINELIAIPPLTRCQEVLKASKGTSLYDYLRQNNVRVIELLSNINKIQHGWLE